MLDAIICIHLVYPQFYIALRMNGSTKWCTLQLLYYYSHLQCSFDQFVCSGIQTKYLIVPPTRPLDGVRLI